MSGSTEHACGPDILRLLIGTPRSFPSPPGCPADLVSVASSPMANTEAQAFCPVASHAPLSGSGRRPRRRPAGLSAF